MADREITREYKGYKIVKEGNPQWRCALNYFPNCKHLYYVYKDGVEVRILDTLKEAKQYVDSTYRVYTTEELERFARFEASLRNETVVA